MTIRQSNKTIISVKDFSIEWKKNSQGRINFLRHNRIKAYEFDNEGLLEHRLGKEVGRKKINSHTQ